MSRSAALTLLLVAALTCVAAKKDDYVYGPEPDWDRYKELGEAAIRAQLPDPANWQVEWPNGYIAKGWVKNVKGYLTCGIVRAVKPVDRGGYAVHPFAVVIDYDKVKMVDYRPTPKASVVNVICPAIVAQGRLPPASMMHAAASVTTVASLGLTVRPVEDGIYVTHTASGTPAAASGLIAGMVITRINGIALVGMGSAAVRILQSDAPVFMLDTAAGQHIEIRRAP